MKHGLKFSSGSLAAKLGWGAFWACVGVMCAYLMAYHYRLVAYSYPLELRESSVLVTTDLLLKHTNPYRLENMPLATNVYGIVYHVLAYPFAKIWGPTFFVHRAIAGTAILCACGLIVVILRTSGVRWAYSCSAALLLYTLWLFFVTPIARPDGVGLLLFLLSAFLPMLGHYTPRALIGSILCGVFAFYAKPYFVLAIPYVGTYLFLCISKQKGVFYTLLAAGAGIASALLVNGVCPVYFINVVFIHKNAAGTDFQYALQQFAQFFLIHSGILGIIVLSVGMNVRAIARRFGHVRFDWRYVDKPLIGAPLSFSVYAASLSLLLIYFSFGRHQGNFMIYHFQLLSPFLVIFSLQLTTVSPADGTGRSPYHHYAPLFIALCMLLSLSSMFRFLHHDFLAAAFVDGYAEKVYDDERLKHDWESLEQSLASYHNILNSPLVVAPQLRTGRPIFDTGQSEFFVLCAYPEYAVFRAMFPSNQALRAQWEQYLTTMRQAIEQQQFDAILLTNNRTPVSDREVIEQYYTYSGSRGIYLFHSSEYYQLDLWLPNNT